MPIGKAAKCPGCGLVRRLERRFIEVRGGEPDGRFLCVFCRPCWAATMAVIEDWSLWVQPRLLADRAARATAP